MANRGIENRRNKRDQAPPCPRAAKSATCRHSLGACVGVSSSPRASSGSPADGMTRRKRQSACIAPPAMTATASISQGLFSVCSRVPKRGIGQSAALQILARQQALLRFAPCIPSRCRALAPRDQMSDRLRALAEKTGSAANPLRRNHLQAACRLVHGFSTALRPPPVQNRAGACSSFDSTMRFHSKGLLLSNS